MDIGKALCMLKMHRWKEGKSITKSCYSMPVPTRACTGCGKLQIGRLIPKCGWQYHDFGTMEFPITFEKLNNVPIVLKGLND